MSDFAEGLATGMNTNNNEMGNGAWWWIIILFALWGNNGNWGNNGGQQMGYELGRVATTNDVASGFASSATLNSLNDIKLGQTSIQQTLCQGFGGINANVDRNGYETRFAINDLGYRLQDCCCATQRAIDGVNLNIERSNNSLQRQLYDMENRFYNFQYNEKICAQQATINRLEGQLFRDAQTDTIVNTIVDTLRPVAKPAYAAPSPFQTIYSGCGNLFGNGYGNGNGNCCLA